jgi:hypothetical protein
MHSAAEPKKHGAGMTKDDDKGGQQARAMLDTFASVGATQFDLTMTSRSGTKVSFRAGVKLDDLSCEIPAMLDAATRQQRNVIVRAHGLDVSFVQLDDIKVDRLTALVPAVFLILETSPANFQAWAAITGAGDKDFARRLRKGTGADATASGATRIAGSLNFKDKYAPDFPRVAIEQATLGRTTTAAELEQLGLVSAPEPAHERRSPARPTVRPSSRRWPDYQRCVDGAPLNGDKNAPDISRADFLWCKIASQWGWGVGEIAAQLMELSPKAHENGENYAMRTARAGDAAAAKDGRTSAAPLGIPLTPER